MCEKDDEGEKKKKKTNKRQTSSKKGKREKREKYSGKLETNLNHRQHFKHYFCLEKVWSNNCCQTYA